MMTNHITFVQFCSAVRREGTLALCVALCTLVLVVSGSAQEAKTASITTFNVSGAGTESGQGTFAIGINPSGAIVGYYYDESFVCHGFLRDKGGSITSFDPQGSICTIAEGLNSSGAIAGYYFDASFVIHGFLRDKDGSITSFDAPGACSSDVNPACPFNGTLPGNINPKGTITGYYFDSNSVSHGFVGTPGSITGFDPMHSMGTFTAFFSGINPSGAITGDYFDSSGVYHGYVRTSGGAITPFDAGTGAGMGQGTFDASINPGGAITGEYVDGSGVAHGFLRTP
jgi:hypothetical protein